MRTSDDVDRILAEEEEVVPSSAFTASVMEAVRRAAPTPAPIPFPWKRALPGLAVGALALVLVVLRASAPSSGGAAPPVHLARWVALLVSSVEAASAAGGRWVVVAALLTIASVRFSMRLARAVP
jgi:hypothetical protein